MATINITATDLTSDDSVDYEVKVSDEVLNLSNSEKRFLVWGVLAGNSWIIDQDTEVEATITHGDPAAPITQRIEDC